ncbi:predicted protein [Nematostella vectensis]|uniref:TLDc domain-containing protein n=1 Tax=Nematostella vectensis TaxID=45351 RepID=A7SZL6_NEMVE|nr:predicted protein [Nematostella vectensis]|eukprot:XP_001622948.1 predicted protein [Nematostella vectensis]
MINNEDETSDKMFEKCAKLLKNTDFGVFCLSKNKLKSPLVGDTTFAPIYALTYISANTHQINPRIMRNMRNYEILSDRGHQSSTKSFLFTLCNKNGYRPEKLPLRRTPDGCAIWDHTSCGPWFGGGWDLLIADNAGGNEVSYTEPRTYARPQGVPSDGPCDVFAGTSTFTPDEMEVFHEVVD